MYAFAPAYVSVWRHTTPAGGPGTLLAVAGLGQVPVQIDAIAPADDGGDVPNPFDIYATAQPLPDIRRGDRLVDGAGTLYFVRRVANLHGDHLELRAVSWQGLVPMTYRQRLAAVNPALASFGLLPTGSYDTSFDTAELAVVDSTVDAATGMVGGYAPALAVHAVVHRGAAKAGIGPFGMQLDEQDTTAMLLSSEVQPTYGDLLIHPDGTRYAVGERQAPIVVADIVIGYAVQVQRRQAGDAAYQA